MTDVINLIGNWLREVLLRWGVSELWTGLILKSTAALLVALISMGFVIFIIWLERKLAGRIQDRLGPNRAGPYGLFQSFADIIKIFTKEYITPEGADRTLFNIAPVLGLASVLLIWAVFPFASTLVGGDINVGVLFVVASGSFGILSILMAGWSSNNKYALLGASRAVAMLISYEIPMIMSLLVVVLLAKSMQLSEIVASQQPWFILTAPLAALIFFISSMAEIGKAPFDLLEAESELVAGYHTEYTGMKFGMFYVSEFLHQFTIGALLTTLFCGGWSGPFAEQVPILGVLYFYLKTFFWYVVISWIRLSLPRIRIDEMLNLNWRFLIPVSFANLIAMAAADRLMIEFGTVRWVYVLVMLGINLVILGVGIWAVNSLAQPIQRQEFPHRPVAVPPETEILEVT